MQLFCINIYGDICFWKVTRNEIQTVVNMWTPEQGKILRKLSTNICRKILKMAVRIACEHTQSMATKFEVWVLTMALCSYYYRSKMETVLGYEVRMTQVEKP